MVSIGDFNLMNDYQILISFYWEICLLFICFRISSVREGVSMYGMKQ